MGEAMKVKVSRSKIHGLGLMATKDLRKGELVHRDFAIKLPKPHVEDTELKNYVFTYNDKDMFLALGPCSFINHSSTVDNAEFYIVGDKDPVIKIYATKPIKVGEEILLNYNDGEFNF